MSTKPKAIYREATERKDFWVEFEKVVKESTRVVVNDGVNVMLENGVPVIAVRDDDGSMQFHSLQKAVELGYARVQPYATGGYVDDDPQYFIY